MGKTVGKRAEWIAVVVLILAAIGALAAFDRLAPAVFISDFLVMFVHDSWSKTWSK